MHAIRTCKHHRYRGVHHISPWNISICTVSLHIRIQQRSEIQADVLITTTVTHVIDNGGDRLGRRHAVKHERSRLGQQTAQYRHLEIRLRATLHHLGYPSHLQQQIHWVIHSERMIQRQWHNANTSWQLKVEGGAKIFHPKHAWKMFFTVAINFSQLTI